MAGPSIAILADGDRTAGLGHVGRCMALAQAFQALTKTKAVFWLKDPACRRWVEQRGFRTEAPVARPIDLLILDTYRLTAAEASVYSRQARGVLVVDDLGKVKFPAQWILNGMPDAFRLKYSRRKVRRLFLGARYHPLRREFWAKSTDRRTPKVAERLLIILGGGAVDQRMSVVLEIVKRNCPELRGDIVVGPGFSGRLPKTRGFQWHRSPNNLKSLMARADLAISGGGQTLFQLARLGVPTIAVTIARNQLWNLRSLSRAGVISALSLTRPGLPEKKLATELKRLVGDSSARRRMTRAGRSMVDGSGALRTAAAVLTDLAAMPLRRQKTGGGRR